MEGEMEQCVEVTRRSRKEVWTVATRARAR